MQSVLAIYITNQTTRNKKTYTPRQHFHPNFNNQTLATFNQQHDSSQLSMGLLGTTLKVGTIALVAHQGIKAYDKRKQAKNGYPQPQYQQLRDASGYLHQPWCNGQCSSQCNGNSGHSVRSMDDLVYSAPPEKGQKPPMY